jgi:hypothetical protein
MNSISEELKKMTESSGFRAGISDGNGKVIYCAEGMACSAGDNIFGSDMILLPAGSGDGGRYFLFSETLHDETADALSVSALKMLSVNLFGGAEKPRTAAEIFEAALENRSGSLKRLEQLLPDPGENDSFRLIVAYCGPGAGDREQMAEVKAVASSVFPEEQGFISGVFKKNGTYYTAVLCLARRSETEEGFVPGEKCALQLVDTASAELMLPVYAAVSGGFLTVDRLGAIVDQTVETLHLGKKFGRLDKCFLYEKMGLERLVSSMSAEDRMEYLKATLGRTGETEKSLPELINTVSVFLDSDQNSSVAAKRMYVHRNTINNRLEKFQKITGLNCFSFEDAVRARIALLMIRYMEFSDSNNGRTSDG